jgi:lysozyme
MIQNFEGLRLAAYRDAVGILTIGYGHTGNVTEGQVIPLEEAERLLRADLLHFETQLQQLVRVSLNQHQFDSLVSFTFNVGLGAFKMSTMRRLLNLGQYGDVSKQFGRWVYGNINQPPLPGLIKRRAVEAALFAEPVAA